MIRYRQAFVTAAAIATLVFAREAAAGLPTEHLKTEIDRVVKTLEDSSLKGDGKVAERRTRVRAVANDTFDWSETAKRALGRHWQSLTDPQRAEFVRLFGDLLERSYISKIEMYGGERIVFVGDTVEGDQAVVRTKILTKQGAEVPIEYRMIQRADKWLVYDVVIESVSLISNYRTQFNRIIQASSYQELVKKMKNKQEEARYSEGLK
jgi:phospholipid transport system substrate-binding protein